MPHEMPEEPPDEMPDDAPVLTSVDDGVMLATINRPEVMNALSAEATSMLLDAVAEAGERDDVHAFVLTGAGRGFCSGAEVGAAAGGIAGGDAGPSRYQRMDRKGLSARLAMAFSESEVPIIGAINGPAVGAGFGVALCCDVRLMADTARIGSIFIRRGLAADFAAAYWLPRLVGHARAHEIFYEGDLLPAERCLELGLANRVVPADELLDAALDYGRRIAAGPPMAYTSVRRMLQRATELPMSHFLEYEWTAQLALLASEDGAEGFRAFLEKRAPEFHGR
jgi:2-(1,2-epoxy-1,2-dihydrophenyl)acetyl-CoA isomerase